MLGLGRVLVLDLEQREIGELVQRHDAHLFAGLALKLPGLLKVNLHRNLRLTLDDVEVRHQETVVVDKKPRAQPAGRAHLHHGFTKLVDQVAHVALRAGPDRGDVKISTRLGGRLGVRRSLGPTRGLDRLGRAFRFLAARDLHDAGAGDGQNGVADVHGDEAVLLGKDFARDRGVVLKLEGIGGGKATAHQQGRQDSNRTTMGAAPATYAAKIAMEKQNITSNNGTKEPLLAGMTVTARIVVRFESMLHTLYRTLFKVKEDVAVTVK